MDENQITYFAETDSRNRHIPFGIKRKDRSRHMYVIGKTGMGKSTLLENMAVQDIQNGEGMAFIDPHGKSAELLLEYVPKERINDVIYFAPFDAEYPIAFNVMEDVGFDKRHLVASGLLSAFKKIWVDAWSARMEYILNNTLLALLEYPDSTLMGVNRMLADKKYRDKVVENITDPAVKAFWVDEFAKYGERYMQEAGAAIQNKVGQFVSNPIVRNIIGQPRSSFDLRRVMDGRKILIVNLSKGKVGETDANLIGSMLITKLYLAAMSRAELPDSEVKKLPDFFMYVDEFQSFANESFANILSEARKYKLALIMAHQYIAQMTDEVKDAVLGNVGTMVMFRVGAFDAEVLEKEFAPQFTAQDMVNLAFVQTYLKLMIDGVTSPPFSARTMPPIEPLEVSYGSEIIEHSRKTYGTHRTSVESLIRSAHQPTVEEATKPASKNSAKPMKHAQHIEKKSVREAIAGHMSGGPKAASAERSGEPKAASAQSYGEPKTASAQGSGVPKTPEAPEGGTSLKDALEAALGKSGGGAKDEAKPAPPAKAAREGGAPPPKEKRDPKTPTKEHLDGLRSALSSVVDKSKTASAQSSGVSKVASAGSYGEPRTASAEGSGASKKKPKEVPESELKKILEVEQ